MEDSQNHDPNYSPPKAKKAKKSGNFEELLKKALKSKELAVFADRAQISNNGVAQLGSAIVMGAKAEVEEAYVCPSTIRNHSKHSLFFLKLSVFFKLF